MPLSDYVREDELSYYVEGGAGDSEVESLLTTNLTGIFGVPYQFMSTVDRRLQNTELGRKYAEKIVARLPLLFLTPGKQVFMEDFSKEDAGSVLSFLTGGGSGDVSELITGKGKYYSFKFDYATYFNYVNAMCHSVAQFMGIGDERIVIGDNKYSKLGSFDWSNATSSSFQSFFSAKENIVFYLDGMTQVSESFSNNTTESSLAATINGFSDTAKEIQFILGEQNSIIGDLVNGGEKVTESIFGGLSGIIGTVGGGLLGSLAKSGVTTVLQGGKIIFPEIWQDSSYERDYSLDIKLRSPDHDSLSIYLNIIVPYLHLVALCLPRAMDNNDPNAYTSPFLVKAFCKGMFNVDMGMITSMSVSKGAECCWNDDGLPTQIDISLTIKDLYSSLFMSGYGETGGLFSQKSIKYIVNNTSLMDFLANMAGLNLAQPEIGRRIEMYINLTKSNFSNTPSRLWTKFDQGISNVMGKLYTKL